jgi:hypothetical protein
MRTAVLRSFSTAGLFLLMLWAAYFASFAGLCEFGAASSGVRERRAQERDPEAVLDHGFAYARAGDALYRCETEHCFPFPHLCHPDVSCYCASSTDAGSIATRLERLGLGRARCSVDKAEPRDSDDGGACLHRHCRFHVDIWEQFLGKRPRSRP